MKNKNKYITVLDFELGRVFQYKVEPLWENMRPRTDYEEYLTNKGHKLNNIEWMVHEQPHIWARHNVEQIEATRLYNYNINTITNG